MTVQQRPDSRIREYRPILADKVRAPLTMTAKADGALHVALHREMQVIPRDPTCLQFASHETHHHLRPANHGDGMFGQEPKVAKQGRHDADVTPPTHASVIYGYQDLRVRMPAPCGQFLPEQQIARAARPIQNDQPAVLLPPREYLIDHAAQRREANPAGDDDNILAASFFEGPRGAERTAYSNRLARAAVHHGLCDLSDGPHRVDQVTIVAGVAADRDRGFPHPEDPQHAELSRAERRARSIRWLERQCEGILRFLRHLPD